MRRNSYWLAILALVVGSGCKRQAESVFVDLPTAESSLATENLALPQPPPGQPAESLTLSSEPATGVLLDSRPELARVRTLIDQDRKRAYRSLVRQYSLQRNADIDDLNQQRLLGISKIQEQLRSSVAKDIRARFEKFADTRAPLVNRLDSLEAFQPFLPGSAVQTSSQQLAAAARAQIAELDAAYLVDRRKIQSQIRAGVDAELTKIAREIADLRVQAAEGADEAATQQLKNAHAPLPIPMAERIDLPAVPSKSMTLAGTGRLPAPPASPFWVTPQAMRFELIRRQVRLWAQTNGYQLQERKGRDATSEFIQWMRDRESGR